MKAVSLARVSSKDQEETGYSLPSQEKLFKDYADRKSFDVIKKFSISESASGRYQRKVFNEMLEYVKKNKITIILCEKVDRLTRNLKDAVAINDWLGEDQERQIHFVKTNLVIHKNSTSDEKFRWDIEVVLSRKYINNLSEEVKKGQKEKLAQGWLPLKPPIGYKSDGDKGHIIHVIDEERAPLIVKMYELYSTGNYSVKALAEFMKGEGLRSDRNKPVSKTTMHRLLSNHFYYGKNEWNGKLYDGVQQPIITKELFDTVQERLSIKFGGQPRYRKHFFVFKGKIRCKECNGTVSWEIQKGHFYGHCNHYKYCSQKTWVKQGEVEEQLFKYFYSIAPHSKNVLAVLEEALKESHAGEIEYNTLKKEGFNRIIQTSDQRIEGAYKDKLDHKMPAALCEKVIEDETKEKEKALSSLKKLNKSRFIYYQAGFSIHELAMNAVKIYNSKKATLEEQRLLLSKVFSNLGLNEGEISTNYTFGFEFLAKHMPKLNNTFELAKKAQNSRKTDAEASVCTVVRGQGDLNPRSPP